MLRVEALGFRGNVGVSEGDISTSFSSSLRFTANRNPLVSLIICCCMCIGEKLRHFTFRLLPRDTFMTRSVLTFPLCTEVPYRLFCLFVFHLLFFLIMKDGVTAGAKVSTNKY